MEKLSREAEDAILSAVDKTIQHVNDGMSPTEAVYKVASADKLLPGYIQLVARAYNTAASNSHRKSAESVLDRAESFPLVDSNDVIRRLYPEEVKSASCELLEEAIADDYSRPPSWVKQRATLQKAANKDLNWALTDKKPEPYDRDPDLEIKRAYSKQLAKRAEADDKRAKMSKAYNTVISLTDNLRTYFKQASPTKVPFAEVRANCELKHGSLVTPLFDRILSIEPRFSKQAAPRVLGIARGEPYSIVEKWLAAVDDWKESRSAYFEAEKQAQEANITRVERTPKLETVLGDMVTKLASDEKPAIPQKTVIGNVLQPVEKSAAFGIPPVPQPPQQTAPPAQYVPKWLKGTRGLVDDLWHKHKTWGEDLEKNKKKVISDMGAVGYDPITEHKLQGIRSEANIQDLILNDEVISGYDPSEVVAMYNDIRSIAPAVSQQPIAMRALLRKHLAQGYVDPYELDLIANLENKLRKREEQRINTESVLSGFSPLGRSYSPVSDA